PDGGAATGRPCAGAGNAAGTARRGTGRRARPQVARDAGAARTGLRRRGSMQPTNLQVRVVEARELNPLIRLFRLRSEDGGPLPGYTAGAHVRVQVERPDAARDWRHYSLIDPVGDRAAIAAPSDYVIAVRRETDGRGGSRFMHERVRQGD